LKKTAWKFLTETEMAQSRGRHFEEPAFTTADRFERLSVNEAKNNESTVVFICFASSKGKMLKC